MDPAHAGRVSLPEGATVRAATSTGLSLYSPAPLPRGGLLECDLLMGARPLPVTVRVTLCRDADAMGRHAVELDLVAMAQADRDDLTDFLQAVGATALRIREHREE